MNSLKSLLTTSTLWAHLFGVLTVSLPKVIYAINVLSGTASDLIAPWLACNHDNDNRLVWAIHELDIS